ncbi:MAG TPA: hypothetical protein VFM60_07180 [Salinimicrobium sp.]|nr:hypothetical protein [Salinimicrobium sp.]
MIAVITADLVDSSNYNEQLLEEVLDTLQSEFKTMQKEYNNSDLRFEVYRGDSFQGIIPEVPNALQIALEIKAAINRIHFKETQKSKTYSKIADFRMAIGIGSYDFVRETIAASNGEAFRYSGRMLDAMKNDSRRTLLKSPLEEFNEEFNASLYLLDMLTNRWSTASAEVVYYLLKGLKEQEISREIGISQSAVNQRKKASGWDAIAALLKRYHELAFKNFTDE